jgi:hypothetical protein
MKEKGSIYDPFFGLPAEERERMKEQAALKAAQDRTRESMAVTESNAQALSGGAQARVAELEANRDSLIRQYGERQYEQALAKAKQAIDAASSRGSELMAQQSQMGQSRVAEVTPPPKPPAPAPVEQASLRAMDNKMMPAGLPGAAQQMGVKDRPIPPITGAGLAPDTPRPTPAAAPQSGLPDALPKAPVQMGSPQAASIPVSPDRAEVEALMKLQTRAAPTAQGVISDVNALMPAGMQEAAQQKLFADQRARAEERKSTFEKTRPSGLDDLIRVFGQAGQYKGLSGVGPAYTANQQQKRAEELAFQKEQDALLTAIEGRSTAADKGVFEARTGAMDKAQSLFGQSQKSILDAAAKKLEASQGRLDKEAQLNMQRDLKMFELAQEERLKNMDLKQRERERATTAANNPAAQAAEFVALKQRARDLRENGQKAAADKLDAQAADMMAFKSGAAATAGERNDIAAVKAEQTGLLKELENLGLPKDVRQRKQQQLDATYKKLNDLYGGTGAAAPQDGKVPPPPPGFTPDKP